MQLGIRKKWRRLVALAALWVFILFPIPFLPLWGFEVSPESFQAIIIIAVVVTIPLTLLFIFMK
ncbi:MAG: hypothetical protein ACE5J2_07740 [Nitrososphaerales archaeon]